MGYLGKVYALTRANKVLYACRVALLAAAKQSVTNEIELTPNWVEPYRVHSARKNALLRFKSKNRSVTNATTLTIVGAATERFPLEEISATTP